MRDIKSYLALAVKGMCMGAADVIPGVSGGTIAFLTGIYNEFVSSISSIDATAIKLLLRLKFSEFWKHINGSFLLSIFVGIAVSVVSLAGLMEFLLANYPIRTWSLFFGLIVASSIIILNDVKNWRLGTIAQLIIGIILGIVICTLSPSQTPETLWFVFLSGAIAICAMILPGISGSFILVILGKYEYIMSAISSMNIPVLAVFLIGAACGIISFSKFLNWLLKRFPDATIMVMCGFIIGSLVKIWPWSNPEAIIRSQFPNMDNMIDAAYTANIQNCDMHYAGAALFALIGFLLVISIEFASNYKRQ